MKKVLFIAYYFDPHISVGVQRVSYWANNIASIDPDITCDVITAIPQNIANPHSNCNVIYVENTNRSLLRSWIKDEGVTWINDLKDFFRKNPELKYDFVVITGGPFMHFGMIPFLKARMKCKVILDFRDPFADNPRFGNKFHQKFIKKLFESYFISQADYVITVNPLCMSLLSIRDNINDAKYHIIENGYNEVILGHAQKIELTKNRKINFVYAGNFHKDRDISVFLEVVGNNKFNDYYSFQHVGKPDLMMSAHKHLENIHEYDLKPYKDTINIINSCDIGIILTGGKEFESTTKIFDYIGLEKAILIITEGDIKTGSIHEITRDYPGAYWIKNDAGEIKRFLEELQNETIKFSYPGKIKYSRKYGLEKLIKIINQ